MKDIIIKADNLHFSYDDGNSHSLNGLSLEIERGKKVAFMGANGSGKSTFFLCCNGVNQPNKDVYKRQSKYQDHLKPS